MKKGRSRKIGGTGKSKLIDEILSNIDHGQGLRAVDPNGDSYQEILIYVTLRRPGQRDILVEPNDEKWAAGIGYPGHDPEMEHSTSCTSELVKGIARILGGEDTDVLPRPRRWERNRPVTLVMEELAIVKLEEGE